MPSIRPGAQGLPGECRIDLLYLCNTTSLIWPELPLRSCPTGWAWRLLAMGACTETMQEKMTDSSKKVGGNAPRTEEGTEGGDGARRSITAPTLSLSTIGSG